MGRSLQLCALLVAWAATATDGSDGRGHYTNKWWIRPGTADRTPTDHTPTDHTPTDHTPTDHTPTDAEAPARDAADRQPAWSSVRSSRASADDETVWSHGYEFTRADTRHFHLLFRDRKIESDARLVAGNLLEHALAVFVRDYGRAGFALGEIDEPLSWVVFDSPSQYRDFARSADGMDSPYLESYYSARSNHVVLMQADRPSRWSIHRFHSRDAQPRYVTDAGVSGMDQTSGGARSTDDNVLDVRRAVHEAAHQLAFNTGLQKRGVMYPMWVSEGLATNFEADVARELSVGGENGPRLRQLLRAEARGRLMPLDEFVTMVRIPPGRADSANDLYAQSWGLFNFLYKARRVQLREYLAHLATLPPTPRSESTMYREFTSAFGPVSRFEQQWDAHLRALRRQSRR